MNEQHDAKVGVLKMMALWLATIFGMSLAELLQVLVLSATLVYTLLQTYVLVRDKILMRRLKRRQAADTEPAEL